jgi:hydroxyacylglutathione hydrolase
LVDAARPVVFVLDDERDRHELVRQCLTVGVESLAGELAGGYETWAAAGLPTDSIALVAPTELDGSTVLDVRQRSEFAAGHVPGAVNVELGDVPGTEVPAGRIVVMCGHGERAMTGASLLERAGRDDVVVLRGGPDDWTAATGRALADQS